MCSWQGRSDVLAGTRVPGVGGGWLHVWPVSVAVGSLQAVARRDCWVVECQRNMVGGLVRVGISDLNGLILRCMSIVVPAAGQQDTQGLAQPAAACARLLPGTNEPFRATVW